MIGTREGDGRLVWGVEEAKLGGGRRVKDMYD